MAQIVKHGRLLGIAEFPTMCNHPLVADFTYNFVKIRLERVHLESLMGRQATGEGTPRARTFAKIPREFLRAFL